MTPVSLLANTYAGIIDKPTEHQHVWQNSAPSLATWLHHVQIQRVTVQHNQ
jgi:hypothetical protein